MQHSISPFSRVLLTIGLCTMTAACHHTAISAPTPSEVVLRNEVKLARLPFTIPMEEDGAATPSDYTLGSIDVFLSSVDAGHADIILMDVPSDTAPERIEAVAQHLKNAGLVYGGTGTYGEQPAAGTITLYVERYTVTPPICGVWSAEQSISDINNTSPHHGCSSIANLGVMVANPRDLIAGEDAGTTTSSAVGAIKKAVAKDASTAKTQPPTGTQ